MSIAKQVGMSSALTLAAVGGLMLNTQNNKVQAAELNSQNQDNQSQATNQAVNNGQQQNHVITINHPQGTVAVWTGISNAKTTGQELVHGSSYTVTREAYDPNGEKWFDLGQNQWIMAKFTNEANEGNTQVKNSNSNNSTSTQANVNNKPVQNQAPSVNYSTSRVQSQSTYNAYKAPAQTQNNYSANTNYNRVNNNVNTANNNSYRQNSGYTSNVSGSEAAAKQWIAMRESGGSYTARNGRYIGRYQLDSSYLGGDYSAANQERVADNYVRGRYGSWVNAQRAWQAKGWY